MDTINPIDNPEFFTTDSRAAVVIGANSFLMAFTTLIVGLRMFTRGVMIKQMGWDDWLSLTALIFVLATGIAQCWLTRQGLGRHIGLIEMPQGLENYLINFYFSILFYNVGIMMIKMSFLAQYYRVLATPLKRKIIVALMVIIGLWSLSQIILTVFLCVPVAGFWNAEIRAKATCIDQTIEFYQNSAGNILTDIIIFVLPLPSLRALKLPRAQKWILLGIFSLGFFTCAISAIRIRYLNLSMDVTFSNVDSAIWSLTELCSGIVCSCLPTLRPLASKVFPGLASRIKSSKGYSKYGESRSGAFTGNKANSAALSAARKSFNNRSRAMNDDEEAIYDNKDLELQPIPSDASDRVMGLREAKMGQRGIAHMNSETGLRGETVTEIHAIPTPGPNTPSFDDRTLNITVQHDIVIEEDRIRR